MLFTVVSVISLSPSAFADHSEVTIEAAAGSGAPGCEETDDGCYIPSTATVDVGGVVIMSNPDTAAHTFTAGTPSDGPSGEFDTGLLMAANSFEWSPDTVGEVPYFCMVHPWMIGTIIVQEVEAAEETMMMEEEETMMMEEEETMMMEEEETMMMEEEETMMMEEEETMMMEEEETMMMEEEETMMMEEEETMMMEEEETMMMEEEETMMMEEEETMMELPEGAVEGLNIGDTALWVEISGDRVYISNPAEGSIHVIDATTNKVINTIQSMVGVTVLEVVEDKNKLYASVMEHAPIQVYDLTTGASLGEIDIGEPIVTQWSKADKNYGQREYIHIQTNAIGLKYNPNTELLYAAHSTVNHVNVIDTNNDQDLGDIPVGKTPLMIEIDQERNIGYVTNWETNDVSVLDLESNEQIKTLNTGFVPDQMEIDYDNNRLYVTHHGSPHVSVIDLRTQEIETKIQLDGPTHALALDTINDILHVTYLPESGVTGPGLPGKVEFIETGTNQVVGDFSIPDNPFTIDIDSENQKLYASIVEDGVIFIVDLNGDPDYQEILVQAEETAPTVSSTEEPGGGCLIATAAYGTELAPQVQLLREIRDNTIMSTGSGASFMAGFNSLYYSFSPTIADMERDNPMFQETVRAFITPMISTLSIMTLAEPGSESDVLGLGISVIALNLGIYIAAPAIVGFAISKQLKSRK